MPRPSRAAKAARANRQPAIHIIDDHVIEAYNTPQDLPHLSDQPRRRPRMATRHATALQRERQSDQTSRSPSPPNLPLLPVESEVSRCSICLRAGNKVMLLKCVECGRRVHAFCLMPPRTLNEGMGTWTCRSCEKLTSGGKRQGLRTFRDAVRNYRHIVPKHYLETMTKSVTLAAQAEKHRRTLGEGEPDFAVAVSSEQVPENPRKDENTVVQSFDLHLSESEEEDDDISIKTSETTSEDVKRAKKRTFSERNPNDRALMGDYNKIIPDTPEDPPAHHKKRRKSDPLGISHICNTDSNDDLHSAPKVKEEEESESSGQVKGTDGATNDALAVNATRQGNDARMVKDRRKAVYVKLRRRPPKQKVEEHPSTPMEDPATPDNKMILTESPKEADDLSVKNKDKQKPAIRMRDKEKAKERARMKVMRQREKEMRNRGKSQAEIEAENKAEMCRRLAKARAKKAELRKAAIREREKERSAAAAAAAVTAAITNKDIAPAAGLQPSALIHSRMPHSLNPPGMMSPALLAERRINSAGYGAPSSLPTNRSMSGMASIPTMPIRDAIINQNYRGNNGIPTTTNGQADQSNLPRHPYAASLPNAVHGGTAQSNIGMRMAHTNVEGARGVANSSRGVVGESHGNPRTSGAPGFTSGTGQTNLATPSGYRVGDKYHPTAFTSATSTTPGGSTFRRTGNASWQPSTSSQLPGRNGEQVMANAGSVKPSHAQAASNPVLQSTEVATDPHGSGQPISTRRMNQSSFHPLATQVGSSSSGRPDSKCNPEQQTVTTTPNFFPNARGIGPQTRSVPSRWEGVNLDAKNMALLTLAQEQVAFVKRRPQHNNASGSHGRDGLARTGRYGRQDNVTESERKRMEATDMAVQGRANVPFTPVSGTRQMTGATGYSNVVGTKSLSHPDGMTPTSTPRCSQQMAASGALVIPTVSRGTLPANLNGTQPSPSFPKQVVPALQIPNALESRSRRPNGNQVHHAGQDTHGNHVPERPTASWEGKNATQDDSLRRSALPNTTNVSSHSGSHSDMGSSAGGTKSWLTVKSRKKAKYALPVAPNVQQRTSHLHARPEANPSSKKEPAILTYRNGYLSVPQSGSSASHLGPGARTALHSTVGGESAPPSEPLPTQTSHTALFGRSHVLNSSMKRPAADGISYQSVRKTQGSSSTTNQRGEAVRRNLTDGTLHTAGRRLQNNLPTRSASQVSGVIPAPQRDGQTLLTGRNTTYEGYHAGSALSHASKHIVSSERSPTRRVMYDQNRNIGSYTSGRPGQEQLSYSSKRRASLTRQVDPNARTKLRGWKTPNLSTAHPQSSMHHSYPTGFSGSTPVLRHEYISQEGVRPQLAPVPPVVLEPEGIVRHEMKTGDQGIPRLHEVRPLPQAQLNQASGGNRKGHFNKIGSERLSIPQRPAASAQAHAAMSNVPQNIPGVSVASVIANASRSRASSGVNVNAAQRPGPMGRTRIVPELTATASGSNGVNQGPLGHPGTGQISSIDARKSARTDPSLSNLLS